MPHKFPYFLTCSKTKTKMFQKCLKFKFLLEYESPQIFSSYLDMYDYMKQPKTYFRKKGKSVNFQPFYFFYFKPHMVFLQSVVYCLIQTLKISL